jgi:TolB protein
MALNEGGNTHLFAYQPEQFGEGQPLPLTRLTYGPWDDINPAISPDGQTIAFASNRGGYWDIYLMDLDTGSVTRLSDTLQYDGAPAWSPDGQWLVYETYIDDNLEIQIQSVATPADAYLLTNDPGADFSPAWSPQGRQIAFISNQSGENEVWLADLDKSEEQRFYNLSQNPNSKETHPAWSPDGTSLLWVVEQDGMRNLFVNEVSSGDTIEAPVVLSQRNLGGGDWPAWSTDGEIILTTLQAPNRVYLTAYRYHYPGLVLPALELPGAVNGLAWSEVTLASPLEVIYQQAAQLTATPLYTSQPLTSPEGNGERNLVQLTGVEAPHPYLHEAIDESFLAMRERIAGESGWDFLSILENAYVPSLPP